MKKIIIGTQNNAKIKQIAGAMNGLCEVAGLPYPITDVDENGQTAQENARIKAIAYSQTLHDEIVLSMDNSLYLEGLKPSEQPGINVRRIPGSSKRPTDQEMLDYYVGLIRRFDGRVNGKWEFAICVAKNGEVIGETTIVSPRIFVAVSSRTMTDGYPLESIQIEIETERYISEMSQAEQDLFWQKAIGKQLGEFVQNIL